VAYEEKMNVKVEQINCNVLGIGSILTGYLKQALQEKGCTVVEDNADVIINSSVTITPAGQALVGKGVLLAGLGSALVYWLTRHK
jgi:hypothetical protein